MSRQAAVDIGRKAALSGLNRVIGLSVGGDTLGGYSILPDVAGEYILDYSTPSLP